MSQNGKGDKLLLEDLENALVVEHRPSLMKAWIFLVSDVMERRLWRNF